MRLKSDYRLIAHCPVCLDSYVPVEFDDDLCSKCYVQHRVEVLKAMEEEKRKKEIQSRKVGI